MKIKTNLKPSKHQNSTLETLLKLQNTRWLFFALCFYLLSQGFTIPILAVGPSWSLWPNLPDFAFIFLALIFFLSFQYTLSVCINIKRIFITLIIVFLGSLLSYVFYLNSVVGGKPPGVVFGIYQLYRLFQFILMFWSIVRIPLTPDRIKILGRIVDFTLVFVCLSVFLTFLKIVPLDALTAHLPKGEIAGPWQRFTAYTQLGGKGWGTIGYNHAYVSAQILMLVSLSIHLSNGKRALLDSIFLILSIVACFLSEARTGLAAMLIFAISYWIKKPSYGLTTVITALFIAIAPLIIGAEFHMIRLTSAEGGSVIDRQLTLLDASNSENLSGRDQIWLQRLQLLDGEPVRWLLGGGFGSIQDSGDFAHMQILQIIFETGVVGLFVFVVLFAQILICLYKYESGIKSIFWVTIAFFVSSVSQEIFYPLPALGHFLGFYLSSVAIALRKEIN